MKDRKQYQSDWYIKNRDRLKAIRSAYYQAHKEEYKLRGRNSQKKNQEVIRFARKMLISRSKARELLFQINKAQD